MNQAGAAGVKLRKITCDVLYQVLHKQRPLDEVLHEKNLSNSRDFGFVKARVNLCARHLGEIDSHLFERLANKEPLRKHYALMILRIAATELLLMEHPAYATIHSAVQVAKEHPKARHFASLINAVLRKLAAVAAAADAGGRIAPPAGTQRPIEINTPPWLWQEWLMTYGEQTAHKIAAAHLKEPPLDITFTRAPPDVAGVAVGLQTWRLEKKSKIEALPDFADPDKKRGFWVQDVAATLPVHVLGAIDGERVLEYGAAPGGKSAQMAARGAQLTALDISPTRAKRWFENQRRLQFEAELIIADGKTYHAPTPFPFILIDAPCSGTGTARRHPELVWIRTPEQVARLQKEQLALLEGATKNLAAGGVMVFAVCSLQDSEGLDIINHYLAKYPSMSRKPIRAEEIASLHHLLTPAGDIRSLPFHSPYLLKQESESLSAVADGMDGFFVARLERL